MSVSIKSGLGLFVRLSNSLLMPPRNYLGPPLTAAFHPAAPVRAGGLPGSQERPWDYLSSEEYAERYGAQPVWADYRRNHKGAIPPQKTRKTCIRGDQVCGNPCPICRDQNIVVHSQNVKLLQQFISPHTGLIYDPTRTGVCVKQQKKLVEAIASAQNHGLLLFHVPFMDFSGEDYSNSHDAVGLTAPLQASAPTLYHWYDEITPDEEEVARVRKKYEAYLKR